MSFQQVVHIEPVCFVGGDSPGRRMRLAEVAHLLQFGHDVANRRRTEIFTDMPRDHTGSNRFACKDKGRNRTSQYLASSLALDGIVRKSHVYIPMPANFGYGFSQPDWCATHCTELQLKESIISAKLKSNKPLCYATAIDVSAGDHRKIIREPPKYLENTRCPSCGSDLRISNLIRRVCLRKEKSKEVGGYSQEQ